MKVIIAPQSFKGSLSAWEAAESIQRGVLRVFPDAKTIIAPVADGGDGTLDILKRIKGGDIFFSEVSGPIEGMMIRAPWLLLNETVVIEMAQVCGLALLSKEKQNPLLTTTFGLGELIRLGLEKGAKKFYIGLGGSATNDGGMGLLEALGIRFLDAKGQLLPKGGRSLKQVVSIDASHLDSRIKETHFECLCDVSNPLTGPSGASLMFGSQKGASADIIKMLEEGMVHYAALIEKELKIPLQQMRYTGSAGGTAAAMQAFLHAKLLSGSEKFLQMIDWEQHLEKVDLVLTGEGRLDFQTCFDKAPIRVAKHAKNKKIPVIALPGSLGEGFEKVLLHGVDAIVPISFDSRIDASQQTSNLLSVATEQALRCLSLKIS